VSGSERFLHLDLYLYTSAEERQPAAEWTAVGLEGNGNCSRATVSRCSGREATGDGVEEDEDTEG